MCLKHCQGRAVGECGGNRRCPSFPRNLPRPTPRAAANTLVYKKVTWFCLAHHLWTSLNTKRATIKVTIFEYDKFCSHSYTSALEIAFALMSPQTKNKVSPSTFVDNSPSKRYVLVVFQVKNRTSAHGRAAPGSSPGQTSSLATTASTQDKNPSNVTFVRDPFRDQTTCLYIWNGTKVFLSHYRTMRTGLNTVEVCLRRRRIWALPIFSTPNYIVGILYLYVFWGILSGDYVRLLNVWLSHSVHIRSNRVSRPSRYVCYSEYIVPLCEEMSM